MHCEAFGKRKSVIDDADDEKEEREAEIQLHLMDEQAELSTLKVDDWSDGVKWKWLTQRTTFIFELSIF